MQPSATKASSTRRESVRSGSARRSRRIVSTRSAVDSFDVREHETELCTPRRYPLARSAAARIAGKSVAVAFNPTPCENSECERERERERERKREIERTVEIFFKNDKFLLCDILACFLSFFSPSTLDSFVFRRGTLETRLTRSRLISETRRYTGMSGMMAHETPFRRRERPPPSSPPRRHRRRYRHHCRRQRRRSQPSWPRSDALPFERGRGARSCNARRRAGQLFLTIYLKCTIFSHRGKVQAASSSMHTALGSAGEKGAAKRGREKTLHYAALRNWHHLGGTRSSFFLPAASPPLASDDAQRYRASRRVVASTSPCAPVAPRVVSVLSRTSTAPTTQRRRDVRTARGAEHASFDPRGRSADIQVSRALPLADYLVLV